MPSGVHGLLMLLYGIHGGHLPSKTIGHAAIQINYIDNFSFNKINGPLYCSNVHRYMLATVYSTFS